MIMTPLYIQIPHYAPGDKSKLITLLAGTGIIQLVYGSNALVCQETNGEWE